MNRKGIISFKSYNFPASFGSGGIKLKQKEGDNITPIGTFQLRQVLYRSDRVSIPYTHLPSRKISALDGWCDDTTSSKYNLLIKLPTKLKHEILWRNDHIYDIIVPIGYNDNPIFPSRGSAIFIHLAHSDFRPTRGCIGLKMDAITKLLKNCDNENYIKIHNS